MDINELMFSRLGLGNEENENENEEDSQNLTWGGFREKFGLPRDLPKELTELIIWKHLEKQPIRRFFQLQLVCRQFQGFLTVPRLLKVHSFQESWMLMQNCASKLPNGPTNRGDTSDGITFLDTYDVLHKRRQLIRVPLDIKSIYSDEVRVSPSLGECGLIFLVRRNFRSPALNDPSRRREFFVFNPLTKSLRQLPLDSSMRQVDRFGSGYLSWTKLDHQSEEMSPLLFDPLTEEWKRIGSGFTTRGHIRMEKAVWNEVVYLRYGRKQGLTDRLIIYDMLKESFRDALTTGLPDNICEEFLFHHEGHIYLATVLVNTIRGTHMVEKNVVLYELNSNDLNWMLVSVIPSFLLQLTTTFRGSRDLKFIHIDHELLVAILVTELVTDGARVYNRNPKYRTGASCLAISTYDITAKSWRRDEADRLGPKFDSLTTVFKPRLDIQA